MIEVRALVPGEPGIDELAVDAGDLVERAYEAIPDGWPLDEDGYRSELRDVAGRLATAVVAVAFVDGVLAGCVTYVPPGTPLDDHRNGEPSFRMLAVDPGTGGRGLGTALVTWVIDRARADGHRHLWLYTAEPMRVAQALYDRLGFDRQPDHDWTFAPERSLLAYRLDLIR